MKKAIFGMMMLLLIIMCGCGAASYDEPTVYTTVYTEPPEESVVLRALP